MRTTSSLLLVLLLCGPAQGAEVCITLSTAKVSAVQEAATLYNARIGTSFTATQWAKEMVREAVVREKGEEAQVIAEQEFEALKAAYDADRAQLAIDEGNARATANLGW